ncbi:protein arginine N-methyltransferase 9-like [Anopheles albimanus]|uniref:Protein arginine N-methyltransferase domain-containing protein n=1 Tax=Anopheles albimanus TaxID=7167 RepID=A0A182FMT6_ANOAL|nr:protein arginine N-methyltransferase 9-like [Anopheles albimanus]
MSSDEEIGELKAIYDFIAQAKFKRAFVCATKVLDQRSPLPANATDEDPLRELVLFTISKYADQLEQEGKIERVFEIIEQGLEYFPGHPELLNETGVRLQRYGRSLEASICFERVLLQVPSYLKAYQNLQNTKCELVERWHFRMLNDVVRNAAFRAAIKNYIAAGYDEVLDIGTGTGLLSMYALHCAGIQKATACDGSEIMVQIARDVFCANGLSDRIYLFQCLSQDLKINDRFSLIVTETLDSGAFGEGILETLIHAKKHLLLPKGKIIPAKVTLYITGYQSRALTASNILINEAFSEEFSLPSNCLLSKEGNKGYDAEDISRIQANDDFEFVSDTMPALVVDFNDLDSLVRHNDGTEVGEVVLTCRDNGLLLDGFVLWFDLQLDDRNSISTDPTTNTCWNQAIFRLNQRLPVAKDQRLKITISCKDGTLAVAHNLNSIDNQISVDEHVIEFLNDSEYYTNLTESVDGLCDMDKILDLSLFPYAGLKLLKEGKTRMLFCLDQAEDLVEFIANQNDIPMRSIMLINSMQEILVLDDHTLDLIVFQPVDVFGQVSSEHFCLYQSLIPKLKPTGIVIPFILELHGSLIESDWIVKCSRVDNKELEEFHINKYLASLDTENHLDLGPFTFYQLSESIKLAEVQFDGNLHEQEVELSLYEPTDPARLHAILYYYHIGFTPNLPKLSTNRSHSFAKRSAFIIPKSTFQSAGGIDAGSDPAKEEVPSHFAPLTQLRLIVLQNHGVLKCTVMNLPPF